jgi:hypothetical protein
MLPIKPRTALWFMTIADTIAAASNIDFTNKTSEARYTNPKDLLDSSIVI